MNKNNDSETLVTVYTTWNHALISLIKSMLDDAEIHYFVKGENFQYMEPIYAFPVEFQVMQSDEEFTRELLKDVEESIEIDSTDDTEPDEYSEEN